MHTKSPKIVELSWGRLVVDGCSKPLKDAKLFPGGARVWDWKETGTKHSPGVQIADIVELIDSGSAVVVLSTGMEGRLQVKPGVISWLEEAGIRVIVLQTEAAVDIYNKLTMKEPVGALIHSTC